MPRPVTLCTGQWADLPVAVLAEKCSKMGFDGLELACWGDHFEVDKALGQSDYCAKKRELLARHNMQVFAISGHLVGQAVLDNIDARHKAVLPPYVWGNGNPAEVNARAAEELKDTARAAQRLGVKKVRITIRLDKDIIEWFKSQVEAAGGDNYQTLLNDALREYTGHRAEPLEKVLRRVVREELHAAK